MRIILTADGSHSLESSIEAEAYHSVNGALQESQHVFIGAGLKAIKETTLNILEIGFGSGLNALLTLLEAEKEGLNVYYEAIEKYPIESDIVNQLNYCEILNISKEQYFFPLHTCAWDKEFSITDSFTLKKCKADLCLYHSLCNNFNLVYFDAFSPDTQPELWSVDVFSNIYQRMQRGGVLVTYSSKGIVKRNLRDVGFTIERLAGAKGKRHMLRAVK